MSEMEFVRSNEVLKDNFTFLDNRIAEDKRMSFRALGLLTFLISKPPGWRVNAQELADFRGHEGRDALRKAIKEMEDAGYLRMSSYRDSKTGQFRTEAEIHDRYRSAEKILMSTSEENQRRKTSAGKPGPFINTETNTESYRKSKISVDNERPAANSLAHEKDLARKEHRICSECGGGQSVEDDKGYVRPCARCDAKGFLYPHELEVAS